METINNSSQINIDELLKESETVVSDSNGLIINDDENIGKIDEKPKAAVPKEYDGPGIVLEKKTKEEKLKDATIVGVNKDTRGYVNDYIAEQNKEIAKAKAAKELMEEKGITPEELKAKGVKKVLTREELQEFKANPDPARQVTIVVERGDLGKIEFTPEQQKLIETATKIVIEEKEQKQFRTLKLRKEPVKNKRQIIPQFFDKTLSPFIALGSGYMGKMKNCSTQDIMKLGRAIDSGANYQSQIDRWQLLYEKMNLRSSACGVVMRHPQEQKTLYLAGDTIWCDFVKGAIDSYSPDVIVVNAAEATILGFGRIIMGLEDVQAVLDYAPDAVIIASHMDNVGHEKLWRSDLRQYIQTNHLQSRLLVPEDGEICSF